MWWQRGNSLVSISAKLHPVFFSLFLVWSGQGQRLRMGAGARTRGWCWGWEERLGLGPGAGPGPVSWGRAGVGRGNDEVCGAVRLCKRCVNTRPTEEDVSPCVGST